MISPSSQTEIPEYRALAFRLMGRLTRQSLPGSYCSLSLWRVVRGSKLMHLDHLIHGLFIT
jgi:hypothetical protein